MAERKACDVAGMTREGGGSRREAVNGRSTGFDPGTLTARGKGPASKRWAGCRYHGGRGRLKIRASVFSEDALTDFLQARIVSEPGSGITRPTPANLEIQSTHRRLDCVPSAPLPLLSSRDADSPFVYFLECYRIAHLVFFMRNSAFPQPETPSWLKLPPLSKQNR